MKLRGQAAVRYLQGGWFEEWAFLQCLDALGDKPRWDVQWSVPFSYDEDGKRTDGECNVLVAGEGTTFLLECKAAVRLVRDEEPTGRVRDLSRKIAVWRDRIAGGRGATAIMLLVPPREDAHRQLLEIETAQQNVSVWIGESGRDEFKHRIRALARIG